MKSIHLPQGFTARNATLDDVPTAVELFNIFSMHYIGCQGFTSNMVETEWKIPKFNPDTDILLVFNPQGVLVGYIEVWTVSHPPVHPWIWGRVHPDYHRRGIGTALMTWADGRARQAIDQCPEESRVSYRSGTLNTINPPIHVFNKFGMALIRHSFRMLIEMDEPPPLPRLPGGITIRTVANPEEDIEIICRLDREAFMDHFGFIEQPFEEELAFFESWLKNDERLSDPSLWFIAMNNKKPVGYALCATRDHENEAYGHVNGLGVIRDYRRRGIGLALLQHAFTEYYRRGKRGVTLGVDAENLTGALRLYKKAGMHVNRQFDLYEKELRPGVEISVQSLGGEGS